METLPQGLYFHTFDPSSYIPMTTNYCSLKLVTLLDVPGKRKEVNQDEHDVTGWNGMLFYLSNPAWKYGKDFTIAELENLKRILASLEA